MSLSVYYTPIAKETFVDTYHFIQEKYGGKTANKFKLKAEKIIDLISENPLMYKSSNIAENVRVGYITKQTALFYRVSSDSIHLLFFWDNRQDPIS